ncbi:MAG: c-type cytochrome [Planctomycetes bacterium]|nr:c-type cytochrome [Planctomycetota bacterium]
MRTWGASVAVVLAAWTASLGAEPRESRTKTTAERGRDALLGQAFAPPIVTWKAYENLWKVWGLKEKPADFDRRVRERYSLSEPPYPNKGLPMGLREASGLLGKGVGVDCMLCHASSITGQPVIGLGNSALDVQFLFDELSAAQGIPNLPITVSQARGTHEAFATTAYLFQFRNADLSLRSPVKYVLAANTCEDVPAWWLLKKKKTMYHSGGQDARSVRSIMSFMLTPFNSGRYIKSQEPTFKDIRSYLLTLRPPKYPFPIDEKKAAHGQQIFEKTCARCHGTYGPGGSYPSKVVDLNVIGTDPTLASCDIGDFAEAFRNSWFGKEKDDQGKPVSGTMNRGYQAPPLDGVWATAPYFHNGAVPTVYHVLNSKARPKVYTRSYRTDKDDYDPVKLGWKITVLKSGPDARTPAPERRKVYDAAQPGRGNGGHPFGDKLSEEERMAVIEYLKTL